MADNKKNRNEINISQGLIGNHFESSQKHTDMVWVKIPNQDPDDKRPWENFSIPASWVTEHVPGRDEGKERAVLNIPPNAVITVQRPVPSETEMNEKGYPKTDHYDRREMKGYELKNVLDPSMVSITCRKSLTQPVKDHPEMTRIAIPPYNEAEQDKPWKTFIVSTSRVHESMYNTQEQVENGKEDVYFKLPENGQTTVRRSYPLGTKEDPQGWRNEDETVRNSDLKDMVEGWKNQERETDIDMEVTGEFEELPFLDDDMPFDIPEEPEQASVGANSDDPSL